MKKCFVFLATSVALGVSGLFADYIAEAFTSPKTGKGAIFWGDASKGKDAYVLEYDEASAKYYFDEVEKDKPEPKKVKSKSANEKTEAKPTMSKRTETYQAEA